MPADTPGHDCAGIPLERPKKSGADEIDLSDLIGVNRCEPV
jgi:hypothetical protein